MYNGILIVNKQQGWTSFDAVNYLKKQLKMKHIGHLGTLDPMATGVLPITLGSATKLFDMFLNKAKTYKAKFQFGYLTDTLDATGNILNKTDNIPTEDQIKSILSNFIGEIEQMPPQYSAKKINGRKACDIARAGGVAELKPKLIVIKHIEFISYENGVLELEIECGSGTYIRAIGRDIAEKLNSLATMISLVRTKVGIFNLEKSVDIKNCLVEEIVDNIIPIDSVFQHLSTLDDVDIVKRLLNGQTIITTENDGEYKLYLDNKFIALAKCESGKIKMSKYFG